MNTESLLDVAGRRRSPATLPGYHAGRLPRNKGLHYPADPPRVEEIVAVMREAGQGANGDRLRGLVVVLWRAGMRIAEALELGEADLDERASAVVIRRGKGGKRRQVGMDATPPLPRLTRGARRHAPAPRAQRPRGVVATA
jgi:integrase